MQNIAGSKVINIWWHDFMACS